MATRPNFRTVVEGIEKLVRENGKVKLKGVFFLLPRTGSPDASRETVHRAQKIGEPWRDQGVKARDGAGSLKGIFYSGCSTKDPVYQGKAISQWIGDLKEKDKRNEAARVLLQAMKDQELARQGDFKVNTASTFKEARNQFSQSLPDLLFLDLDLPVSRELETLKNLEGRCDVDVVKANPDGSVESLGEPGAAWSADGTEWESRLLPGEGIELHKVSPVASDPDPQQKASGRLNRLGAMVGSSQAMQEVYALISKVASTDASVLVTGESGTGKELVAQALQAFSRRSRKPYLAVNCGAISSTLIDSELFGHEQGSFTGANHLHKGHFERASGGTIFLDEITEMPLELQVKLLRVLETGDLMRVGGDQPVSVDVRVIAATNRPLEEAMADGKLREDLFYRLNVFPIHLPPLRERQEDLDLLAEHFLAELNKVEGQAKKLTRPALERLRAYHWPGNVRELKNFIQRAFILAGEKITPDCLPKEVGGKGGSSESCLQLKVGTPLAEAEKRLILATFDYCEGNKMKTAEVLGISLRTLYNRLEAYSNVPREVESQSA